MRNLVIVPSLMIVVIAMMMSCGAYQEDIFRRELDINGIKMFDLCIKDRPSDARDCYLLAKYYMDSLAPSELDKELEAVAKMPEWGSEGDNGPSGPAEDMDASKVRSVKKDKKGPFTGYKSCKVGKPCGRTCIASWKRCYSD